MAIHNEEYREMGTGRVKKIDEGAIDMMFRMAQEQQYQYPIKSTVRELLSNAVDAVADKKVAIDILSNNAKVEDYFVEREGPMFKDSKWDPTYYSLDWLSKDNEVSMHYVIGKEMVKDKVIIKDFGVGLGGKRLEGYMNLG